MAKVKVISLGKTKEPWLESALEEYVKRLKPWATCEFLWAKNEEQFLQLVQKEPCIICLDAQGKQMSSEAFADFMQKKLVEGGATVAFAIGGPEGLPSVLKTKKPLMSLSTLTFTHQMVRLILLEQVYRAFTIADGLPYHK